MPHAAASRFADPPPAVHAGQPAAATRWAPLARTLHADEAIAHLAALYGRHALVPLDPRGVALRLEGFAVAGLHVAAVSYGAEADVRIGAGRPGWVFSLLRGGHVRHVRSGDAYAAGDAAVLRPDQLQHIRLSADMDLVNLRIDTHEMDEACRALWGGDMAGGLQLRARAEASQQGAAALKRVLAHLASTPVCAGAAAQHFERSAARTALLELLLCWPQAGLARLGEPAALPASTRRAREYMHEHLEQVPSVADVALACGVGVRALCKGFEKHLGTSPSRYLVQLRLDAARADLMTPSAPHATVTRAATRWGFFQLGDFSAMYRRRFGELPSDTLRQARG